MFILRHFLAITIVSGREWIKNTRLLEGIAEDSSADSFRVFKSMWLSSFLLSSQSLRWPKEVDSTLQQQNNFRHNGSLQSKLSD